MHSSISVQNPGKKLHSNRVLNFDCNTIFHDIFEFLRIYVDAIINHMTGTWNENVGTGGSVAVFNEWYYPAVAYGRDDFNWPQCEIQWYDYGCCAERVSIRKSFDLTKGPSVLPFYLNS